DEGLRLVQLREPTLAPAERELFTTEVLGFAKRHGAKVLTKSPTPGADGVHYTAAELMRLERRPGSGLAAASCHTRAELERAMALGLAFAVLGPVLEERGAEPSAWRAGAHGVAMIRAAWR